jgi:hypothetical protein
MDVLDRLFQEWHQLGGQVLVSEIEAGLSARRPEQVLAETTAYCRESSRLTWVALDWLIHHIEQVDVPTLVDETTSLGNLAVLGVLCDAAHERKAHPKFLEILRACTVPEKLEPFFKRVARSPLALAQARQNSVAVFRRWNYLSAELRYL